MKRLLLLFLFIGTVAVALHSQSRLREPLRAIPTDSVMMWSNGVFNWRMAALAFNSKLVSQPYTAEKSSFTKLRKAWQPTAINWAGGKGDLYAPHAVYEAGKTLSDAAQLFLLTGESSPIDLAERSLLNLLPYTLRHAHRSPFEKGAAAQSLLNGIGLIYATDGKSIYVNFFTNSFAKIRLTEGSITLDQITEMPYLPGIRFRVGGLHKGSQTFGLRIRLPEWAMEETTEIVVNGHEYRPKVERGYFVIERTWNNHDEVYLHFPFTPRLLTDATGSQAIALGALLCVPRKEGATFPTDATRLEIVPDSIAPFVLQQDGWEFVPFLFSK